jgi:hypothetical protein
MTTWIVVATIGVTLAAAVRSTWSPCGLSMLSSITPLSEVGRGHRFGTTASWYVAGSIIGGATLGLFVAALTVAVDALALSSHTVTLLALAASAIAVLSDTRTGGFHLPVHHRQVNERWLDRFRPWVYGAGFGWQIGSGLVTYIMTSAVYLMIVLSALSGRPWFGVVVGVLFGLGRGMSVCLGRHITSTEALTTFHRRFFAWGPTARRTTVAVEVVATALFAAVLSPWALCALGVVALLWVTAWQVQRRTARAVRRAEVPSADATMQRQGASEFQTMEETALTVSMP